MSLVDFRTRGIATLILAAGGSSRLGTPKQLIRFKNETLIRRICRQVTIDLNGECAVVLGANPEACRQEIADLPAILVQNDDWSYGLGSSIAIGTTTLLRSLSKIPAGILVCLVDQPLISTQYLGALCNLYCQSEAAFAASEYGGKAGVPAIFGGKYFDALRSLTGHDGAKSFLAKSPDGVFLDCKEAAFDIDVSHDVTVLQNLE
jgi:molybdenum cofactor cytidylyltransferase